MTTTQSYISIPNKNPKPAVCNIIPEGGDHSPDAVLATSTPLPPEPLTHKPVLIVVKMAKPFAFLMTSVGIFFTTLTFPLGDASAGA